MKTARMKKSEAVIALSAGLIALIIVFAALLVAAHLSRPETSYSSSEVSSYDFNGNGLSDAMDLVLGARADAEHHPTYDGRYWQGGYPPDNIGVCTDVVWRAFRAAGYSLRDMVDADIAARPSAYPNVTQRDSNIDFRRVKNLRVFFRTYAVSLTNDIRDTDAWQPGDIVIFGNDKHIGIISDKRTESGRPYVIHNGGQNDREEDALGNDKVTGHYRFDAERLPEELRIAWSD